MKICAAQTKPTRGDINANIESHRRLIELAIAHHADLVCFPELSITGYEPELAAQLATTIDDQRFNVFDDISTRKQIIITAGMPIKTDAGILIGMIIFQPGKPRSLYCKQHLHSDEFPFFINGTEPVFIGNGENKLALSICYELSVPEHSDYAHKQQATLYLSSVAKTADGVTKAAHTLAGIAEKYSMMTVMANCVGHCDNFDCGGKTSAWNKRGVLVGQLDDCNEGILIVDTQSEEVVESVSMASM